MKSGRGDWPAIASAVRAVTSRPRTFRRSWKFGYDDIGAIEVWNGPWTIDDEVALATWDNLLVTSARSRQWVPALGNSDAHSEPQVIGLPQSVVPATSLERGAIMTGIKRERLWVAESKAVDLSFSAAAKGAAPVSASGSRSERPRRSRSP